MIKNLILIGLFVLPLFVLHGYDFRYPRELLALGLALGIAMFGIYNDGSNELFCQKKDKWFLIFIGWCLVSTLFIPHIKGLEIGGSDVYGLWNYKAILYLIVYALAFFVICNIEFSRETLNQLAYAMLIPAVITSVIVIGQYFGIENFFRNPTGVNEAQEHLMAVTQYKLGGLMGHPTLSSAYLAVCLPIAFYLKRYFIAILIIGSVIFTDSHVAICAVMLSGIYFWCLGNKLRTFVCIGAILWLIGVACVCHIQIQDSGRFGVWLQIWKDMTTPFMNPHGLTYFFTGLGIGSFAYLFPAIHSNDWLQAHNEYLQVFFGAGAVGLGIMLHIAFKIFKDIWKCCQFDRDLKYFSTCFFVICVCAGGTFVWQLGVFQFYTIVILGVVYNLKRRIAL